MGRCAKPTAQSEPWASTGDWGGFIWGSWEDFLPLSLWQLLPSPGHAPHLLLDQAPLSLCKLLSRVSEPHCSACESFCPPISASLPATTECWVSRTDLSGGTGSRSEPPSRCCPLHHSTMHSIIWTTSIVWTSCKYCSKKAFSPTG